MLIANNCPRTLSGFLDGAGRGTCSSRTRKLYIELPQNLTKDTLSGRKQIAKLKAEGMTPSQPNWGLEIVLVWLTTSTGWTQPRLLSAPDVTVRRKMKYSDTSWDAQPQWETEKRFLEKIVFVWTFSRTILLNPWRTQRKSSQRLSDLSPSQQQQQQLQSRVTRQPNQYCYRGSKIV